MICNFSARQHGPGDLSELVAHGDHDAFWALWRRVRPARLQRCSMPLDPQHGSSCTVDQNLAGKTLPRLLNSSNPALPPLFMLSSVMAMVGGKRRGKVFGG